MRRLTALTSAAFLLGFSGTLAQAPTHDPGPELERIASAFRSGRAQELRALTTPSGRVRVDVRNGRSTMGSYGPGQFEAVFARLFAEHETIAFDLRTDTLKVYDDTAFARGAWIRRARDQPRELTQVLTFTLWRENAAWHLVEIRSSP